jgi:xanthine/uracil permease
MRNIGLAAATLLIIIPIYRFLGGFFNRVAILFGVVLGTVVAIPFGAADYGRLGDAAPFQLTEPFHFGTPTFAIGAIVSMLVVMLVIMTETTADILAIGEVVDKRLTAATSPAACRPTCCPPPWPASPTASRSARSPRTSASSP